MNEEAAKQLAALLKTITDAAILSSRKADALEAVLRKDPQFEAAYKRELAKTTQEGSTSDIRSEIDKFQSKISWR